MENETVNFDHVDDIEDDEVPGGLLGIGADTGIDDAFLAHLDTVFLPLMQFCAESCTTPVDQAPLLQTHSVLDPTPEQMFAQQKAAFERFCSQRWSSPPKPNAGKPAPRTGKGVVYIGFDAEWEARSRGYNKVLSEQFVLVGPTGGSYEKVFDMSVAERGGDRMRLGDALGEVLEEAEDEGVLLEWPREVVLIGFFTRADITVFSDFKHLRPQLDGVGGTLASVKGTAKVSVSMSPARAAKYKSRYEAVLGDDYDPKLLSVRLVDASLFAPPGTSLSKLGAMLGLPKLDLPDGYAKDQMSVFQRKEPEAFNRYGLRDAEIAVWYVLWVRWFSVRFLGLPGLSATASSLSVRLAEKCMHEDGIVPDVALNFEKVPLMRFDSRTGLPRRLTERHPSRKRGWLEKFLADCYQGGRNECYWFGPTPIRKYSDPDLAGAYVTTLVELKTLDYDKAHTSTDLNEFLGDVAGFAEVAFRFPENTAYPCLPVNAGERGLIFPIRGVSLCTSPEIELAVSMGAELEILFGYVIPWAGRPDLVRRSMEVSKLARRGKNDAKTAELETTLLGTVARNKISELRYLPFKSFAIRIRDLRTKFRRKTLAFEFVKLLGNSLYGKTGQGFRDKRTFGPREMGSVKIGQSRVSEPAVAALVCGMVRAVVGEILAKLPAQVPAVSCTTDGMIIGGELADLDLSGPICSRFRKLVEIVTPDMPMLENKHTVSQVVALRTRGQLTGLPYEDEPIVLAKTSVRPPSDVEDQNLWLLKLFAERTPGQIMEQESFISMRDQLIKGWDLQMERSEVKLNLEFDFKRRPVRPHLGNIALTDVDHLAFDTEPWETAEQAIEARLLFDGWRRNRCLKTLADFEDWQAFYALQVSNTRRSAKARDNAPRPTSDESDGATKIRGAQGRIYKTQKTGYVGIAVRAFLKAYSQREWGLDGAERLTQAALADWLTSQGHPTSLSAVKNASRAKVHDEAVPRTEEVERFVDVLCEKFPSLQRDRFFISSI